MNFEPSDERRMLADSLGRYLSAQYSFSTRQAIVQSPQGMQTAVWQKLAELGVLGALFRQADGGFGGDGFDIATVFETLGRALVVEPVLGSAVLAGEAIALAATGAQRQWLDGLISGSTVAGLAHEEPHSHYEMSLVQTTAQANAQGWLLNGSKALVLQGGQCQLLVVSARTGGHNDNDNDNDNDNGSDSEDGISLFLLPADTPGVQLRSTPTVDGGMVATLDLKQVQLPADALLGTQGAGFATLERAIGRGVLALCAEALGVMDVAKDMTLDYLRTRKQFGVAIGSFQALQHRMADMVLEIEQARSAVINAAAALDSDRVTRERALSAAKFSIGRIGTLVAEECIQMHGGIGMTWELPLSHYAKRLVMIDHQLGDEDHHLQRYIALSQAVAA
jgi:alkylation response protein AidB-like acyl-CoA dehydrogenase